METYEWPKGELVRKKYTPTSPVNEKGIVDFPIKIYKKSYDPTFPHGGKMTMYLDSLPIGSRIMVDGPYKRIEYFGDCLFKVVGNLVRKRRIGFVAGGTGITPYYPIILNALEHDPELFMSLVYCNKTVGDIMFKDELELLSQKYPDNFKLYH